jgi:hypothetical protein
MNAVLLLAYRRWENIDLILDECRFAGVPRVYIHIDGGTTVDEKEDVARTFEKASIYKNLWGMDIRIHSQSRNIGCAVSMILSLDSVFFSENQIIVLEDDCIPTPDFFHFIEHSLQEIERNPRIGLACGAQFGPSRVMEDQWLLSRYPFNWGWGVTKSKWALLSAGMIKKEKLKPKEGGLSREETTYWNAGVRRTLEGYTDVWDTLLVREMIRHGLLSILPAENLVRNVGNDSRALHTIGDQPWTNFPTGIFNEAKAVPVFSDFFDLWVRQEFFKISCRHLITTRVTWCLDKFLKKPKRRPLPVRIQFAAVDFSQ